MTVSDVMRHALWAPIRDCPGRYVLHSDAVGQEPVNVFGPELQFRECESVQAWDRVFVARLEDGGIISYLQPSSRWVHTLGTATGFARKLAQLGIVL